MIADLVKPETPQAVQMLHRMGLKVVLVTGDNRRTAHALAEEVTKPLLYILRRAQYSTVLSTLW